MQATETPTDRRAHLARLTTLRAVAALGVFAYHLDPPGPAGDVSRFGYTGVAFFFVLSGFVLAWQARDDDSTSSFYLRRFARIWPSHAVMLCVALFLASPVTQTVTGVVSSVFLVQAWSAQESVAFVGNGVAWTLSCEAFFYAVLPFVLPALRARSLRVVWAVAGGYAAVAAVVVVLETTAGGGWAEVVYLWPPVRLGEFLLGVAAAIHVRRGARFGRDPIAGLVLVGAVLFVGLPRDLPGADVAAAVLSLAVVVAAAQRDLEQPQGWLTHRWLVYAGQVSFAFYLVHQLVVVGLYSELGLRGAAFYAGACVVSAAAAVVLHHGVERPAERRIRTWSGARGRRVAPTPTPVSG